MKRTKKKNPTKWWSILAVNPLILLLGVIILFTSLWLIMSMRVRAAPTDVPDYVTTWGEFGSGDGQFGSTDYFAVSSNGRMYLSDRGNSRINIYDADGTFIKSFGSLGSGDGQFTNVQGVAINNSSELVYVVDSTLRRVQVFELDGEYVSQWSVATNNLWHPQAVAIDEATGNVYVSVSFSTLITNNVAVAKYDSAGTLLTTFGTSGSADGQFSGLKDIYIRNSELFTVERINNRVQVFDLNGTFSRKFGSVGSSDGQFNNPLGIYVDSSGFMYVADDNNYRIQKFASDGTYLTQWGSQGSGTSQFNELQSIRGNGLDIYTSETNVNFRIQKFSYPNTSDMGANDSTSSNSGQSGSTSPQQPRPEGCGDFKPEASPVLFQVNRLPNSATVYFSPVRNTTGYVIRYGLGDTVEQFGTSFDWSDHSGVITYTIYDLDPNASYSFQVRAQRGCQPGEWSNVQKITSNRNNNTLYFYLTSLWK